MAYTTLAAAKTAYLENNGYMASGSRAEALAFVRACSALLLLQPKRGKTGRAATEIETDPESLRQEKAEAQRWLAQGGGTGGGAVRHADLSNFRDQ